MNKEIIEIEHPGIMLKEDFLDDLGIKSGAFAKAIGIDRAAIKNIIDGKRAITADMSLRFGLFFDMSLPTYNIIILSVGIPNSLLII